MNSFFNNCNSYFISFKSLVSLLFQFFISFSITFDFLTYKKADTFFTFFTSLNISFYINTFCYIVTDFLKLVFTDTIFFYSWRFLSSCSHLFNLSIFSPIFLRVLWEYHTKSSDFMLFKFPFYLVAERVFQIWFIHNFLNYLF